MFGYPNILGTIYPNVAMAADGTMSGGLPVNEGAGALGPAQTSVRRYFNSVGITTASLPFGLTFNASLSNSLYDNDTNQPAAISSYILIKI